jgi:hypothetical protein
VQSLCGTCVFLCCAATIAPAGARRPPRFLHPHLVYTAASARPIASRRSALRSVAALTGGAPNSPAADEQGPEEIPSCETGCGVGTGLGASQRAHSKESPGPRAPGVLSAPVRCVGQFNFTAAPMLFHSTGSGGAARGIASRHSSQSSSASGKYHLPSRRSALRT